MANDAPPKPRPQVLGVEVGAPEALRWRLPFGGQALSLPPVDKDLDDKDSAFSTDSFLPQEALSSREQVAAGILILTSMLDVVVSGAIAVVAVKSAYQNDSSSLACLATQAVSHIASSISLISRFIGDILPARERTFESDEVPDALLLAVRRRRDLVREKAISIAMGIFLVVFACGLVVKAWRKIEHWDSWYLDHEFQDRDIFQITNILAWWGFAAYALQSISRFAAAHEIRRSCVWHAFSISFVSVLFLLVLGVGTSYQREWSWKAEPIAAAALVFICLCEAAFIIYSQLGSVDKMLQQDTRA